MTAAEPGTSQGPGPDAARGAQHDAVRAAAFAAHAAGLCVFPPAQTGSKAPDGAWKEFQTARPSDAQVSAWYDDAGSRTGLGLVCGAVSGNLEALDFDAPGLYDLFLEACREAELGELVARAEAGYFERTPSGGAHLLYRCDEVGGNSKLAQAADHSTWIETRGERGFIIVAPSFGSVHPSGDAYTLVSGGFDSIAHITPDERAELLRIARTFDQTPEREERRERANGADRDGLSPGDDFNARATWAEVLEPAGWQLVYTRGEVGHWRRPGKEHGISATTNAKNSDKLVVFSTSTEFEIAPTSYSKFGAFAVLEHGGDFSAAARALAAKGYGTRGGDGEWTGPPPGEEPEWGGEEPPPSDETPSEEHVDLRSVAFEGAQLLALLDREPPPPVVAGVPVAGHFNLLVGPAFTGKSAHAYWSAMSRAAGVAPWEGAPTPECGRVLVVSPDESAEQVRVA